MSVLKAIDASKKLRLDKFQTQVEEYQGLLENSGLVGYAQEVLEETDHSCFVQTAKQLHHRYGEHAQSPPNAAVCACVLVSLSISFQLSCGVVICFCLGVHT